MAKIYSYQIEAALPLRKRCIDQSDECQGAADLPVAFQTTWNCQAGARRYPNRPPDRDQRASAIGKQWSRAGRRNL